MASRLEPYRLEAQVGHLLRRAHQRHVAIFIAEMGEDGPTPTQFAALAKLAEAKEVSQNHLGRLTGMDPGDHQGVVSRLMERGLVERAAGSERPAPPQAAAQPGGPGACGAPPRQGAGRDRGDARAALAERAAPSHLAVGEDRVGEGGRLMW